MEATSSILTKDNVTLQLSVQWVKNRTTSFMNSFVACLELMWLLWSRKAG